MIRVDPLFNTAGIDNLDAFLEAYPELALETIRDDFNRNVSPHLLSELKHYPPPAKHPFQFATEKSRRYYFFAVNNGLIKTDGKAYVRTGQFGAGWKTDVSIGDGIAVLSVRNPLRAAKFITGNRQVPGHRNTGWMLHQKTIDYWVEVERQSALDALKKLLENR